MSCAGRQLTDAEREAAFEQQRTGVQRGIRPFTGEPTPENIAEYLNREVFPVLKQTRDKVNEVYLPVVDNAPSANPLGFYFSETTTNADPTTGFIRLDNATQDTATTIRVSQSNGRANDITPWLDVMSGSATSPLGVVTLSHAINPGRFIRFDLTSMTDQGTYWDLAVSAVESSHDNPFAQGDQVAIQFIPGVSSGTTTVAVGSLTPVAAETFIGNFTAGVASPAARAGSSVAGGGLTYTAGGTLAVGAGTGITVAADSVGWNGTTTFVPDGDKGHIVVSASGATWLWDNPISITGTQTISASADLNLDAGDEVRLTAVARIILDSDGEIIANGPGGTSLESCAVTSSAIGAGDVVINADSGIGISAGSQLVAVAAGTVDINATADVTIDATDDITINAGDDLVLQTNGTTRARINAGGDWDFENGLDFDVTGTVAIDAGGVATFASVTSVNIDSGNLLSLIGDQGISCINTAGDFSVSSATDVLLVGGGDLLLDGATGNFHRHASGNLRIGYAAIAVMAAITTRTNSTTALTGATGTAPANTWSAGTSYRFSGMLNGTRGATNTASNVVFRITVAGSSEANANLATTQVNGANFTCWVEGYVTCITTGSSGTAIAVIRFTALNNATTTTAGSTGIATFTLNTTVNNTLALAAEFSAAVADLSMTWQSANIWRTAF